MVRRLRPWPVHGPRTGRFIEYLWSFMSKKKQNITYREKMHSRIVVRKSLERKLIKIRSQQSTSNNLPHVTSQCVNSRQASPMCTSDYVEFLTSSNIEKIWRWTGLASYIRKCSSRAPHLEISFVLLAFVYEIVFFFINCPYFMLKQLY